MTKNIYEDFRIAVIEAIHSFPYDEAAYIDGGGIRTFVWNQEESVPHTLPITLDRVLLALSDKKSEYMFSSSGEFFERMPQERLIATGLYWKLVKEDGFTPATHEDQSEDTLRSILQLLK